MWHSAGIEPGASGAITSGSSANADSPVSSTSNAGSASSDEGEREPVGAAPPAAPSGRHLADLAGADAEPRRVEPAAQRQLDRRVAVPAEVGHGAVVAEQVERELEAGGGAAGVDDEVEVVGRVLGERERRAECGRDLRPVALGVDEGHLDARHRGQQAGHAAPDHAGADDGDPVADERPGVPQRVDRGLDRAGEHGTRAAGRRPAPRSRPRPVRRTPSGGGAGRTPCDRPGQGPRTRPRRR